MVRRQFLEQVAAVAAGEDPVGVTFDENEAVQSVIAGNYLVGPGDGREDVPLARSLARFE